MRRRPVVRLVLTLLIGSTAFTIAAEKPLAPSKLRWSATLPGATTSTTPDGKYVYALRSGDKNISVTIDSQEPEKSRRRHAALFSAHILIRNLGQRYWKASFVGVTLEFVKHFHVLQPALDPADLSQQLQASADELDRQTALEKSDSTTNTPVCTASGSQQNPQACSDGANGMIVVWEDFRNGNWDIYAQRLNADGVAQWAANGINICTSVANQTAPVICSDGGGGAYVAWKDLRNSSNGTDIYGQHINGDGTLGYGASGSGIAVAADATAPTTLSICPDGYGNAFVAWEDSRTSISSTSRPDIYMNKLTGGGPGWGGNSGISVISQSLHQTAPKLVDDGFGGCYLVWVNSTLPASIWSTRVSGGGSVQWGSTGVQIFGGSKGSSDACRNPSVSRDGNQLCVTWEQLNSSSSTKGYNLLGNRIKSDSSHVWGNDVVGSEISTDWAGDQINSLVFTDDSVGSSGIGGLLAVYENYSGTHSIAITRLLPNGSDLLPAFPNQIYTVCRQNNEQTFARAVKTVSGELLIVWNDTRQSSGSTTISSIYAQRCDRTPKRFLGPTPSTSSWGLAVSTRSGSSADEVQLVSRTNGGIAVWRDNRNGNTDIYAQLIFRDGTLPIELASFSLSTVKGGKVLLNWETASEKNNAGFEIERRLISDPNASNRFELAASYLKTSSLLGSGFSGTPRTYSFLDIPGNTGIYEYRLVDYSLDGEKTVHDSKHVELKGDGAVASGWSVGANTPNPFTDRTNVGIDVASAARISVEIIDVLGRIVAEPYQNADFSPGHHIISIASSMLGDGAPSGAYYCVVRASDSKSGELLWQTLRPVKLNFIRK